MGCDSRSDFYEDHFLKDGKVVEREALDASIARRAARLNGILSELRANPLGERMVVFGSAARGRFLPTDVDVVVDLRAGPEASAPDLNRILRLARGNLGWLDPFVLHPCGRLAVRDEDALSWVAASNARGIKAAIASEGRPLSDVVVTPDPGPVPYEPDAWRMPGPTRARQVRRSWVGVTRGGWCRKPEIARNQREILAAVACHEHEEVRALFDAFCAEVPEELWRDLVPEPRTGAFTS